MQYDYLKLDRTLMGVPLGDAVSAEAQTRNAERVLVVMAGSLARETNLAKELEAALGARMAGVFAETVTHVPRSAALALAEAIRTCKADFVRPAAPGCQRPAIAAPSTWKCNGVRPWQRSVPGHRCRPCAWARQ